MEKIEELRKQLADIDASIERGRELQKAGYDCGYIIAATQTIRDRVAGELEEAEREAGQPV